MPVGDTTSDAVTSRYASPLAGSGGRKAAIFEMEAKLLAAEAAHKQSLKQVCNHIFYCINEFKITVRKLV